MASSPIQTILKIEDLTSEDDACNKPIRDVLSESEILCSIDEDDDDEQMVTTHSTDTPSTSCNNYKQSCHNKTEEVQSSENRDYKHSVKTKPVQYETMATFMIAHPDFSKGIIKTQDSRIKYNDLWNKLSNILNKSGPPTRGAEGWRKVWSDYKAYIRNKLRKNKIYYSQPRGWPKKLYPISRLEKKVALFSGYISSEAASDVTSTLPSNVIQTQIPSTVNSSTVDEATTNQHSSVGRSGEPTASHDLDESNDPPSRYSPPLSRKYKKLLLQSQIDNQKEYTQDSKKIMLEINDNLKGILRYSIKSYELDQKRFLLEKEKFVFKQKTEAQKHQTEMEKLQLQRDLLRLKQETAGIIDSDTN